MILLVAALAAANLIGLVGALEAAPVVGSLDLPFPVAAPVIFAGAWAVIFGAVWVGLLVKRPPAQRWAVPLVTIYAISRLFALVFLARAEYDWGRLPFQIALTLIALLPLWWIALRKRWLLN